MRAAFSDPQGPWILRAIQLVLPALLVVLALVLGSAGAGLAPSLFLGMTGVGTFAALGFGALRQQRRRPAEITCGAGYVDVRAGVRSQRIDARSIVGATTTRVGSSVVMTLAHSKRDQPLTLALESEADAEAVRRSLGIGHGGFGTIAWRTEAGSSGKAGFAGRIITLLYALIVGAVTVFGSGEGGLLAAFALGQIAFIAILLSLVGAFGQSGPPGVLMTAEGLKINTLRGWFMLPYDRLLEASATPTMLRFRVPPPYGEVAIDARSPWTGAGLSAEDREVLVAQVTSAAQRARGLGPDKVDVTGRVDVLRRHGESARDWLVRLDMAGQMLSTAGYRGQNLDVDDLWAILEDPDADAELRAAAARVLRHSGQPDARVRIDAAVAAVRDESTGRRLRVAVRDDLDAASAELAELDALDYARRQERAVMMGHPPVRLS